MKLKLHYATLVILAALLSGCASLGIPTADTFNEKLAAGYVTVTAIRTEATGLLKVKRLTPDDTQNVLDSTNTARTGLDVTRTISKTDLTAANARLIAITTGLTALQAYLATRKGN